jgi:hypothetical protein
LLDLIFSFLAGASTVVLVSIVQPLSGVAYGLTLLPESVNSVPVPHLPLQVPPTRGLATSSSGLE